MLERLGLKWKRKIKLTNFKDFEAWSNSLPKRTKLQENKCVYKSNLRSIKWEKKTAKRFYRLIKKYFKTPEKDRVIYITNMEMLYPDKCVNEHPEHIEDGYCNLCDMYVNEKIGCAGCDVSILFPVPWWRKLFPQKYKNFRWIFVVDDSRFTGKYIPTEFDSDFMKDDLHFMLNCGDIFSSHIQIEGTLRDGLGERDLERAIALWFKHHYDFDANVKWVDM